MNSFFNKFLNKIYFITLQFYFLMLLLPSTSFGITIFGVHTGNCDRDLGIILRVNPMTIDFLSLDGKEKQIPRYEIIYLSYYNVSNLPISQKVKISSVSPIEVKSLQQGSLVNLIKGWPIDYSSENIIFLSSEGSEFLLDRDSIWSIRYDNSENILFSKQKSPSRFEFVQPFSFKNCSERGIYSSAVGSDGKIISVYPQMSLSEPLVIKKELDRLMSGSVQLEKYNLEQNFFAVPQYYQNWARVGIWNNFNSRYGSSVSRTNNLLPFVVSEKSKGPFEYQHIVTTGVAPFEFLSHEEAQSILRYSFKASYVHMNLMLDPNTILLGYNYFWKPQDFKSNFDIKMNDTLLFEFGLDFGHFQFGFGSNFLSVGSVARLSNETILFNNNNQHNLAAGLIQVAYRNHWLSTQVITETGKTESSMASSSSSTTSDPQLEYKLSLFRFNLGLYLWENQHIDYSLISKDMNNNNFDISVHSTTNALYYYRKIWIHYWFGSYLSLENLNIKSPLGDSTSMIPKFGASLSLEF